MNKDQFNHEQPAQETLRSRAERRVRAAKTGASPVSIEDLRTALEELQIYRAELEMQNEELCTGRALLEETQKRYFRHFDLAPVGLVRLSSLGLVLEANILGAAMLGVNREQLHRSRQLVLDPRRRRLTRSFSTASGAGARIGSNGGVRTDLAHGERRRDVCAHAECAK